MGFVSLFDFKGLGYVIAGSCIEIIENLAVFYSILALIMAVLIKRFVLDKGGKETA